ncbi:glycosyltransferase family 1 protein [Thiohalocapsa sp. ML1]|jgi:glycosyltransferase involved in cell wall biosynthesis|uniref:glycosyltransferase family 4 protein n=1 Tax=Thiohalocapsa sp. ML1 TaxID=1431688 RepID=UPI0007322D40|nr:glycosyltransferase family 1 protein [Thiohalocapsa sp. ML1]
MGIVFNGRFATRPATGVERVGYELLRALLSLQDQNRFPFTVPPTLAVPNTERADALKTYVQTRDPRITIRKGLLPGQIWEQFELPFITPSSWLISPCNLGPISRRKQLLIIHDAQWRTVPEAYSFYFRALYASLQPRLARRVRHVVTVSQYSKNELERFNIVPRGKTRVIYNGADHILRVQADLGTLARYGLSCNGYILALGSLAPHKNLRMLINAAAARKSQHPELVIAGGTDARIFSAHGLHPQQGCRFLGRVSDSELKALYENALALAFPSITEGFGLPPLEAMYCGCPVLASHAGAVPEVCGDAALYTDPQSIGSWASTMEELSSSQELRVTLAARGRESARKYTWGAAARAYLDLLADLGTA